MKNDPSFALAVAIIIAGVVVAFAGPSAKPLAHPAATTLAVHAKASAPVTPVALAVPSDATPLAAVPISSPPPRHRHVIIRS